MLDSNGSRTVSVDKAALKELSDCVIIAMTALNDEEYTGKGAEALRNIQCANAHERVEELLRRLSNDANYHERDIAALEEVVALARDKAGDV